MTDSKIDAGVRETISEMIYLTDFCFNPPNKKPEWIPGGNSLKQDEARRTADAIIRIVRVAPASCDAEWQAICDSYADENQRLSDQLAAAQSSDADTREALERFASLARWPLHGLADTDVVQCRVVTPDYETGGIERAFFGLTVADFKKLATLSVTAAERCAKCGCETRGETALVNGEIWCHPCADVARKLSRDEIRNDPTVSSPVKGAMEHFWKLSDQYEAEGKTP